MIEHDQIPLIHGVINNISPKKIPPPPNPKMGNFARNPGFKTNCRNFYIENTIFLHWKHDQHSYNSTQPSWGGASFPTCSGLWHGPTQVFLYKEQHDSFCFLRSVCSLLLVRCNGQQLSPRRQEPSRKQSADRNNTTSIRLHKTQNQEVDSVGPATRRTLWVKNTHEGTSCCSTSTISTWFYACVKLKLCVLCWDTSTWSENAPQERLTRQTRGWTRPQPTFPQNSSPATFPSKNARKVPSHPAKQK